MPETRTLDQRLTPHFTLREVCASATAARHGINNIPPLEVLAACKRVCEHILEPIRTHYSVPFSPNSFFRCLELNRILGSKDTSQHTKGEAVDVEVSGVANLDLARWCADNLDFDQLILEFYDPNDPRGGWVHVSYVSAAENRRQILTIGKGGTVEGLPQ